MTLTGPVFHAHSCSATFLTPLFHVPVQLYPQQALVHRAETATLKCPETRNLGLRPPLLLLVRMGPALRSKCVFQD